MNKFTKIMLFLVIFIAMSAAAVVAEQPEKTNGFVCPVLGGQAGEAHGNSSPSPFIAIGGDDYSIIGPYVTVPIHATNDDGAGTPPGHHASPGDTTYTAIWAGN
jgi:hypothetical protein